MLLLTPTIYHRVIPRPRGATPHTRRYLTAHPANRQSALHLAVDCVPRTYYGKHTVPAKARLQLPADRLKFPHVGRHWYWHWHSAPLGFDLSVGLVSGW